MEAFSKAYDELKKEYKDLQDKNKYLLESNSKLKAKCGKLGRHEEFNGPLDWDN